MSLFKEGRGGSREGSGRKRLPDDAPPRKMRCIRCIDEEWEIIRPLAQRVKHDPEFRKKVIDLMKE